MNCKQYFEKTFSIDPSPFLSPFVKLLPSGASVLDVGCGSGRDLLWLKNLGYKAVSFERSKGLAQMARKNSGCKVIEGDFEVFDFSTLSFDAVLSSGSMVHTPHENVSATLINITKSMLSAIVYISFKEGLGTKVDGDRIFYLWSDNDLKNLFKENGFEVIASTVSESAVNSKDVWIGYVLIKNTN